MVVKPSVSVALADLDMSLLKVWKLKTYIVNLSPKMPEEALRFSHLSSWCLGNFCLFISLNLTNPGLVSGVDTKSQGDTFKTLQ